MSSPMLHPKRPVNLDLMSIRQPLPAIASILHRISGILLFLLMPFMLYALHQSLISPEHFLKTQECFQHGIMKLITWVFLSALLYHTLAGIRHLLMDFGIGETAITGRKTASLVLLLAFIGIIGLGVYLW
jgi:succinate dehydrogenase / fumarate reductase cytochrome b subunit